MTMAVVPTTTLVKKGTGTATLMLTAKDTASHHSFNKKIQPSIYLMFTTNQVGELGMEKIAKLYFEASPPSKACYQSS